MRESAWAQRIGWGLWAIAWAGGIWLSLWSTGLWDLEWADAAALVPIVVGAVLSALVIDHFGVSGWKTGLLVFVLCLLLIPALDLLIDPGCAGLESVELYRTPEGSIDTRCTETADMTAEGVSALAGLAAISGLVVLLVKKRRSRGL